MDIAYYTKDYDKSGVTESLKTRWVESGVTGAGNPEGWLDLHWASNAGFSTWPIFACFHILNPPPLSPLSHPLP